MTLGIRLATIKMAMAQQRPWRGVVADVQLLSWCGVCGKGKQIKGFRSDASTNNAVGERLTPLPLAANRDLALAASDERRRVAFCFVTFEKHLKLFVAPLGSLKPRLARGRV
jgi:hypothetical protein